MIGPGDGKSGKTTMSRHRAAGTKSAGRAALDV
jgi:hypothetical protein